MHFVTIFHNTVEEVEHLRDDLHVELPRNIIPKRLARYQRAWIELTRDNPPPLYSY